MRALRPPLLLLAMAVLPGCVVAGHAGYGHGYAPTHGYARPYYAPGPVYRPVPVYRPAPVYRPWHGGPHAHWRGQGQGWHGQGWQGRGWQGQGWHGQGWQGRGEGRGGSRGDWRR